MTTIAVTGASGFVGSNLVVRLNELSLTVVPVAHDLDDAGLQAAMATADLVVHLAGVNRPIDSDEFTTGNEGMTKRLTAALLGLGRPVPVIYASSTQAELDNPYGLSKRAAEAVLEDYAQQIGAPIFIFRLANVFGKWCRPNYNSVVATFCHNISHGLPINISDAARTLKLVYIDDVVARLVAIATDNSADGLAGPIGPEYEITLGELAAQLTRFRNSRTTLVPGAVGTGLLRALHATYLSYLDPKDFDYPLTVHTDPRGSFAEVLRTPDAGQFSYFTAHPGITRGGHYHHSKTEKFLVLQGKAHFGFRHIVTGQTYQIRVSGEDARVVETIPGWSHNVTNIGDDSLVVMLWASEVFDRESPDTIAARVLEK